LGLGSCVNIPVIHSGTVLGTVNLLAEEHHFTPDRLTAYEALVTENHAALIAQMRQG
jgi:DNA-binding IclR family transcriptional regulator